MEVLNGGQAVVSYSVDPMDFDRRSCFWYGFGVLTGSIGILGSAIAPGAQVFTGVAIAGTLAAYAGYLNCQVQRMNNPHVYAGVL